MRILRNDDAQTWELQPTTPREAEVLTSVLCVLKRGQRMEFHGSRNGGDGHTIAIRFNAGGEPIEVTNRGGWIRYTKYTGGVTWWLETTPDNRAELWSIRNTCYIGSGGLIFLKPVKHDREYSLIFTAKYCKLCGAPMLDAGRCEWATCWACVERCDHQWERGAIWGRVDIGVGFFCGTCGVGKPDDEEANTKTSLDHAVAAEQELGIIVWNKRLGMTASQVKQVLDQAS